jgi:CTP:molybdopterin cytidylyltransferase MocA
MESPPIDRNIFVVVLAAGSSRRFGSTKQLAMVDGQALVRRAVDVASEIGGERTVLVAGHDWQAIHEACEPLPGFLLVNDEHASGIGTSIALAARTLSHAASAILIVLADQPRVAAAHLRSLCAGWSGNRSEIVATGFDGTRGPPVLLPAACFDDLAALSGDRGAKALLADDRFKVVTVSCPDAAVDVDTPGDLDGL